MTDIKRTEADYMAIVADVLDGDKFRQIVQRAANDAVDGDAKARSWLTSILLKNTPQLTAIVQADLSTMTGTAEQYRRDAIRQQITQYLADGDILLFKFMLESDLHLSWAIDTVLDDILTETDQLRLAPPQIVHYAEQITEQADRYRQMIGGQ